MLIQRGPVDGKPVVLTLSEDLWRAVEDCRYPTRVPSEAEKIRALIEEWREEFGGEMPRARRDQLRGSANIYSQLLEEHEDRYPVELIQNAHDACAEKAARAGKVWFVWSDSALHIADNGAGFAEENVRTLCAFGNTTKLGDKRSIGYKGIGFVSVYELTDTPQVITHHKVSFGFDLNLARSKSVPPMLLPKELSDSDFDPDLPLIRSLRRQGAKTVIRLPFRSKVDAYRSYEKLTAVLQPEALLFMAKLGELEFRYQGKTEKWSCKPRQSKVGIGTVHKLSTGAADYEWLLAGDTVTTPRDVQEKGGWREVDEVEAAVAVPWSRGRPVPSTSALNVHAYYPTDEMVGCGILIHGDFQVTTNRRNILTAKSVSRAVSDLAIELAVELAEAIAGTGIKAAAGLLDVLGDPGEATGFGKVFRMELFAELESRALVPTRQGEALSSAFGLHLLKVDRGEMDAKQAGELVDLLEDPDSFADPAVLSPRAVAALDEMNINPVTPAWFAQQVAPTGTDFDRTLRLLEAWVDQIPGARPRQQALDALGDRPVVLDSTGTWREPGDVILGGGLSEEFADLLGLRIAKNPRFKQAREFLEGSLGVNQLDVGSVVRRVAKVVENLDDGFDEEHEDFGRHDQLFGVLRSVWDVDAKAFKKGLPLPGQDNDWDDEISLHLDNDSSSPLPKLQIPVRNLKGTKSERLKLGSGIYFPKSWSGDSLAERLYRRFNEAEFLALEPPPNSTELKKAKQFLTYLGVQSDPLITGGASRGLFNSAQQWRPYYHAIQEEIEENCGEYGHPQASTTGLRVDLYMVEKVESILLEPKKTSSEALLELLDKGKARSRDKPDQAFCSHKKHSPDDGVRGPHGYQEWLMNSALWVPSSEGLIRPDQCWTGLPKRTGHLKLPRAPGALGKTKGITTANYDKPLSRDLVVALGLFHEKYPDATGDVAYTADWLMAKLARAPMVSGELWLLAHSDSGRVWVGASDRPLVWDLPGFDEVVKVRTEPIIWDEEADLASLPIKPPLPCASEIIEVVPGFDIDRGPVPVISEEVRCGIVAATPSKARRYIAKCLLSMASCRGEGLRLTFREDKAALAVTETTSVFLDIRDNQMSRLGVNDDVDALTPPKATLYYDTSASSEGRRGDLVRELLRFFHPRTRDELRQALLILLAYSPKEWVKNRAVTSQGLADAKSLLEEIATATTGGRRGFDSKEETSKLPSMAELSESEDLDELDEESEEGGEEDSDSAVSGPRKVPEAQAASGPAGASLATPSPIGTPQSEAAVPAQQRSGGRPPEPGADSPIRFPKEGAKPIQADDDKAASEKAPARKTPGGRSRSETAATSGEVADEFKSSVDKMRSEEASIESAKRVLKMLGAKGRIHDERKNNLGWDLRCEIGGRDRYVEVKSSRKKGSFTMTRNEREKLTKHKNNYMVIFVSNVTGHSHKVRVIRGLHEVAEQFAVKDFLVTQREWGQVEVASYDMETDWQEV